MTQRQLRALITGASRGIGEATALALAAAGIHVALVSRSEAELKTLAAKITQLGVEAKAYSLDLAQLAQVKPQIQAIAKDFGPLDILINNAGMGYTSNLYDTPLADWQTVMDLNLTSVMQCIQAVLPEMRQHKSGTIVNVVSVAGRQGFPGWSAYCASKFGLMGLTKALALEERAHGIRVIALCPGAVNTPIWDSATVQADFDRTNMLTPESVAQSILHVVLLPQQAVVEELVLMPNVGTF